MDVRASDVKSEPGETCRKNTAAAHGLFSFSPPFPALKDSGSYLMYTLAHRVYAGFAMKLSARNKLDGTIEEIKMGDVIAHVTVRVSDGSIDSVITRRSAEEMNLKVGDKIRAVIKSTEVMLEKD